jgi:hypothetical protein
LVVIPPKINGGVNLAEGEKIVERRLGLGSFVYIIAEENDPLLRPGTGQI